jgi:cellulose biosynthesis protein BcsQ
MQQEEQEVYTVNQEKGGGGKSPTAMHLGYASSYIEEEEQLPADPEEEGGTLLIDLDPQASLSQHALGAKYEQQEPTVYDALVNLKRVAPIKLQNRLYLLPAHNGLEQAEIELPRPGAFYQVQLRKMIALYPEFRRIIIDTPGSRISIFATLALTAANYALVPAKCEISHYYATIDTLALIEDVREGLNPALKVWAILPNQYEDTRHSKEILDLYRELKDPTGHPYPVYPEPSRKTTKYNDATSMNVDARRLDDSGTIGPYWDRMIQALITGKVAAR